MHLTYGYDLKENDDIVVLARRAGDIMGHYALPGAALVNHLPFRAFPYPLPSFQCLTHIFSPPPPFVGSFVQVRTSGE